MADKKTGCILDTDPWYDPDDTFALLMLLNSPELRLDLIVTGDEVSGKRAALTKWYLELCKRTDIQVVVGTEHTGRTKIFCDDIVDYKKYRQQNNFIEAIHDIVEKNDRTVYIGIQSFSNLARFLQEHPELKDKIELYQMGGVINPRERDVEHNVRIAIPEAQYIMKSRLDMKLVTLDTTSNQRLQVNGRSRLYRRLAEGPREEHQILKRHCDLFYQTLGFWTHMHDPLTASVALGKNFVDFYQSGVEIDSIGKMRLSNTGNPILLSKSDSRAKEFLEFLEDRIFPGGKNE